MMHRLPLDRSERGMVLLSSLAILLGLMLVGLGAGTMLQNDFRIAANLKGSAEAFYHSSAGLELGKRELARTESFPPALASRTLSFSSGSFAVSFHSPAVVGPLTARVLLRSIGTSGVAKHMIEAQIIKTHDLADAALMLRGNGTGFEVGTGDVFISGADHDETGTRMTNAAARSAVSAGDDTLQPIVSEAIKSQPASFDGGSGLPVFSLSEYVPGPWVSEFADQLCASPAAVRHAVSSTGLTFASQGWGTHDTPQLHCFEGSTESVDSVTFGGNMSGVGILVVKDADLVLTGTFRWDGLIIVTGSDVSFKTADSDPKQIFGAAVVNEIGIPGIGRKTVEFEGAIRIAFSRWALGHAVPLIPTATLAAARSGLPARIEQKFWRSDSG